MRTTIIGAGAIGGITGAYMARAGADVTLVDQAEEIRAAIGSRASAAQRARLERYALQV